MAFSIAIILTVLCFINTIKSYTQSTYHQREIARSLLQSATSLSTARSKLYNYLLTQDTAALHDAHTYTLSAWGVLTPYLDRDDLPKLEFNQEQLIQRFESIRKLQEEFDLQAQPSKEDILSLDERMEALVIFLGHSEAKQWSKKVLFILKTKEQGKILITAFFLLVALLMFGLSALYIISLRKRKLKELLDQQSEELIAKSKMAALGEFSATIVHEINNPLTIAIWRLNSLRTSLDVFINGDPRVRKNFNSVELSTKRIDKIIKGIKLLTKDAKNEDFEVFEIDYLKTQIEDLIEAKSKSSDFNFKFNTYGEITSVRAKQVQLAQVLSNLVNNSIDAIQHKESRWIRIDAHIEEDMLSIDVTDSGDGLSEKDQASLFNLFYTTKSKQNGTGIGLNYSQKIISDHGGTLTYNSFSSNTQFQIQIPQ